MRKISLGHPVCTGYRNTGVIICKRKKGSVTFQDDMKGKYLAQYFVIVIQILR